MSDSGELQSGTAAGNNSESAINNAGTQGNRDQPVGIQLQAHELINLLETTIKRRLDPVVQEMQLSKLQRKSHTFKFQGNEHQNKFKLDIHERISRAATLVESDQSLTAIPVLRIVQADLERRNKLIRMANSSDCGWKTVEEYEDTGLRSDSEDEKRIRAAEERARHKRKDNGFKGAGRNRMNVGSSESIGVIGQPPPCSAEGWPGNPPPPLCNSAQGWFQEFPGYSGYQPHNPNNYAQVRPNQFPGYYHKANSPTAKGSCYNCGSFDHWYSKCPMPKKG